MLTWSLRLDFEFLSGLHNMPFPGKIYFIVCKYSIYLKSRFCGARQGLNSVMVFGGRFHYNDMYGLASLQRVYCASHTLKGLLPGNAVIVEVGANIGQFNHFGRHYLGARRIISIEPVMESFELLQRNASVPSDCLRCAVSDVEGDVLFHVAQESSQLSSYVADENSSYRDSYLVPARRLDSIAAEMKIDRIDLLKIDTEGSELDVLKSAGKLLSVTDLILVEMSVFRNSSGNIFKIGSFLEEKGFTLVELSSASGRRPKDVDGVFKRV